MSFFVSVFAAGCLLDGTNLPAPSKKLDSHHIYLLARDSMTTDPKNENRSSVLRFTVHHGGTATATTTGSKRFQDDDSNQASTLTNDGEL